jgi:hypothetical protein
MALANIPLQIKLLETKGQILDRFSSLHNKFAAVDDASAPQVEEICGDKRGSA